MKGAAAIFERVHGGGTAKLQKVRLTTTRPHEAYKITRLAFFSTFEGCRFDSVTSLDAFEVPFERLRFKSGSKPWVGKRAAFKKVYNYL